MTRIHPSLAALSLSLACATAASAQDVKYEKYTLDNGLTVILHEDHSLPVAAVNIWYRVGSKDEPAGRSGFAHLFEHLMFMGTQRVPGNQFDVIMEAEGGSNNASTSNDRTNYFESGPSRLLPTLLWLEADRLEDLARTMTQEKLDTQRAVVRNERRQSYENRPYGKADLAIQGMMYPPGHPYHIPVIGTHADLEAATVHDVKDFFATFYVPNNLSLCVAGDFDPARIKPLIERLFGTLPAGGQPMRRGAEPATLDGVKRATMLDKVQLPLVAIVYHSPALYADGDAEADLMSLVLAEGKTSRLYKRLVYDDRIAVDVSAVQDSNQLGSMFRIDVTANTDADLDRVEKTVDEELARLVRDGPTDDELTRFKNRMELAMLSRLQSVEARADQLNQYEYYFGEPNSFKRDLDRYRNATKQSVQRWAARILAPDARVIMRVLPEAPQRAESPREARPASVAERPFSPPPPETLTLKNGVRVMLWPKRELPLVALRVIFQVPDRTLDPLDKAGTAELTADMLDEGAGRLDALQFADAIQMLGATFAAGADPESISVSMTVLRRNFDPAAALLAYAIRRPRFDEKEWQRVHRLHIEDLKQQDDQPTIVAARVAARRLFGAEHPYGLPVAGTPESAARIGLDDVRTLHAALFRPDAATILLAGDLTADDARAVLEPLLGDWRAGAAAEFGTPTRQPPRRDGLELVIVDRPEAVQTVIRFTTPAPGYNDARRVPLRLINTLFGGSFTSRLNQNLREKHGYTYGARSSFALRPTTGYFAAGASVRADVTGASLKEFLTEIGGLRGGNISDEEVIKARETLRTDVIQAFAGLGGVLAAASEPLQNGLPFETLASDMAAMTQVAAPGLNALTRAAVPLEQGVIVLVGDKASILKQIAELKLDLPAPVEVTVRGEGL